MLIADEAASAVHEVIDRISSSWENRVRDCRLRALIPRQIDLSQRTGIPPSTISALENQRLFLSSYYAIAIAEAIGCSLDNLYHKKEEDTGGD